MKRPLSFSLLAIATSVNLVSFLSLSPSLTAQPENWAPELRYSFSKAREQGGTVWGGGGKSDCPVAELPLTALVPKTDQSVEGQTIAARPTFWFYVPYTSADKFSAQFSLQDKQGREIYTITRTLPQSSGIMSIRMPPTAPPLQVNQSYRWTLQLPCSTPAVSVWGWVQRVETPAAIRSKLSTLSSPQKAALFAENGFWFDALTEVGLARRANPQDAAIANAWVSLLTQAKLDLAPQNQAKLEEIARQPIVR